VFPAERSREIPYDWRNFLPSGWNDVSMTPLGQDFPFSKSREYFSPLDLAPRDYPIGLHPPAFSGFATEKFVFAPAHTSFFSVDHEFTPFGDTRAPIGNFCRLQNRPPPRLPHLLLDVYASFLTLLAHGNSLPYFFSSIFSRFPMSHLSSFPNCSNSPPAPNVWVFPLPCPT